MEELIQSVADAIEKDHSVRHEIHGVVRDIDTIIRKAHAAQQSIYSNTAKAAEQLTKIHGFVEQAQQQFAKISSLYPADQYYRYSDIWKSSIVSITQLLAFTHWFQSNELIPVQLVSQAINNFPVEMEDYLLGICGLPSDLVRFTINSVTAQDYASPIKIQRFVNELYSGFRLLNLKNDGLRRRMDTIKYDVKKIEEVVYDLSIRGLIATNPT
eukprot:TRINITY_DN9572_c0_g1_i3.p1 TRINITY_DN9572_c0_g1~~TRINITY_DN9572_c0_g1_i3.p1  ORF type:complete len:213 (-),score=53.92 TRINITY_DN9572_c0_g1_i3:42-680(-)